MTLTPERTRGLLVPADDEEIAAPRVLGEEDVKRDGDDEHHPEQHRDREPRPVRPGKAEEARAREAGEGVVVDRNRRAVGDEKADAAQSVHRRQRHDERGQTHLHDAEGVEDADQDADGERDRDGAGDGRGEAEIVGQQQGHRHRDEAGDRADRKVDAAGDDGEGLADGEDRDHRPLAQEIGDVVRGPEGRGPERQREPQDEQQAEKREAEKHVQPAAAPLPAEWFGWSDPSFPLDSAAP